MREKTQGIYGSSLYVLLLNARGGYSAGTIPNGDWKAAEALGLIKWDAENYLIVLTDMGCAWLDAADRYPFNELVKGSAW